MNVRIRSAVGMMLWMVVPAAANAQTAEDKYLAARDVAIERFTPERVPNIGQREMEAEGKARAELDKLLHDALGTATPAGFEAGKYNVTTLFSGDMDFGKLDGFVFEADGGDTQMLVTTHSLLLKWLQAKWLDAKERLAPDAAIKTENFYLRALGSDATILRYAAIPLGVSNSFAMLAARAQDAPNVSCDRVLMATRASDPVRTSQNP